MAIRHAVTKTEAFRTCFFFSLGLVSGALLSLGLALCGVLAAWTRLGFKWTWIP